MPDPVGIVRAMIPVPTDSCRTAPAAVLIVEDEPLILLHSRLALEDAGYEVIAASDAQEAIACLEGRPGIAAMFADVRLPGALDGAALAGIVARYWPGIALTLTSGGAQPEMPDGARFLAKPYTAAQVCRTLAAAVG